MTDYADLLMMPLTGIIFLILYAVLRKFPPRDINNLYGYRTARSMRNKENWDFAQSYSNSKIFESALFLLIISGMQFMYPADTLWLNILIQSVLIVLTLVYIIYSTEMALKQFEAEQDVTNSEDDKTPIDRQEES